MKLSVAILIVGALAVATAQADSLNCRLVGSWPFGAFGAVTEDEPRELVYVGSGAGVMVLDVSDPAHPAAVGEGVQPHGMVADVECREGRLYVITEQGELSIWEMSTPAQPVLLGGCHVPGRARDLTVGQGYAYVAADSAGLVVVSLLDPGAPRVVGTYDTPRLARGVVVAGNYAWVADYEALLVLNVEQPDSIFLAGSLSPLTALAVDRAGDYAFVAAPGTAHVVSMADPAAPREVATFGSHYEFADIRLRDSLAFLMAGGRGIYGIGIYDVSDPLHPSYLGGCPSAGQPQGIAFSGDLACVSCGRYGLKVADFSDPAHALQVGDLAAPGSMSGVAVSGTTIALADYSGCSTRRTRSIRLSAGAPPRVPGRGASRSLRAMPSCQSPIRFWRYSISRTGTSRWKSAVCPRLMHYETSDSRTVLPVWQRAAAVCAWWMSPTRTARRNWVSMTPSVRPWAWLGPGAWFILQTARMASGSSTSPTRAGL